MAVGLASAGCGPKAMAFYQAYGPEDTSVERETEVRICRER